MKWYNNITIIMCGIIVEVGIDMIFQRDFAPFELTSWPYSSFFFDTSLHVNILMRHCIKSHDNCRIGRTVGYQQVEYDNSTMFAHVLQYTRTSRSKRKKLSCIGPHSYHRLRICRLKCILLEMLSRLRTACCFRLFAFCVRMSGTFSAGRLSPFISMHSSNSCSSR